MQDEPCANHPHLIWLQLLPCFATQPVNAATLFLRHFYRRLHILTQKNIQLVQLFLINGTGWLG